MGCMCLQPVWLLLLCMTLSHRTVPTLGTPIALKHGLCCYGLSLPALAEWTVEPVMLRLLQKHGRGCATCSCCCCLFARVPSALYPAPKTSCQLSASMQSRPLFVVGWLPDT